jgi:cell division protein FtsI/penicillin-binding protein 2
MKASPLDRYHVLLIVVALLFSVVAARLAVLQIGQMDFWRQEAWKARTTGRTIPFERGWILDRNMTPLAFTEMAYDLRFIYGYYRKGSAAGRIAMVYYLLNGRRPDVALIYSDPAPYVDEVLALSLDDVTNQESPQKSRDLVFYLAGLISPDEDLDLFSAEGGMSARPFSRWPSLAGAAAGIRRRVEEERRALGDLEKTLGISLIDRIANFGDDVDRKVFNLVNTEGPRCTDLAATADARLAEVIDSSYRKVREYHAKTDYVEKTVCRKIPHNAVMRVKVNIDLYPGFYIVESAQRQYPADVADLCPNLIGRVGHPGPNQMEARQEHADTLFRLSLKEDKTEEELFEVERLQILLREIDPLATEEVGILGLERLLEPVLRGKRGYEFIEQRHRGAGTVLERSPPLDGMDVVLTLDAGLQAACERVLSRAGCQGALVLIDARSGAVLSMATSPRPTRWQLRHDYGDLLADRSAPLLQRAINGQNLPPPGSVFKLVTAVAALEEGLLSPVDRYLCEKRMAVGRRWMKCDGLHGEIDLNEAIVKSCNIYFYNLSRELDYATMFRWAEKFGFGKKTAFLDSRLRGATLNAGGGVREAGGPLKKHEQGVANLMRFCIGQGAIDDVTPLQVARMVAGIATGTLPQPYLLQRIGDRKIPVPPGEDLGISSETLRVVRDAMRLVPISGTARPRPEYGIDLTRYSIAGKTGTAQVGGEALDHAWFAGYFPCDRPRIAFAVLVESTRLHGGQAAAPLLQRFLEEPEAEPLLKGVLQ